jgi:hypothetical protein
LPAGVQQNQGCDRPGRRWPRVIAFIAMILAFIPWVLIPIGVVIGWLTG